MKSPILSGTIILTLALGVLNAVYAASATWSANPVNNDWYTAKNWIPVTVPNGPDDVATIGESSITSILLPEQSVTELDSVIFQAHAFIIVSNGASLTFEGIGALGGFIAAIDPELGSSVTFRHSSTSDVLFGMHGHVTFRDHSTAGNDITCYGGENMDEEGAVLSFLDQSAAVGIDIIINPGIFGGRPSAVYFNHESTADNLELTMVGDGILDISGHKPPGLPVDTLGYIGGVIYLGNNNLTVTKHQIPNGFSGIIQDGGVYGGTGGSLTKVGSDTDTLSLTGENSYTGGTFVEGGILLANNRNGSATGTGPIQVNAGTLGGIGTISGAVTIGSGSGSGAFLAPGINRRASLTILSSLTFNADGVYNCRLNANTVMSGKVTTEGVTINSGARFFFVTRGNQPLPQGTVFTVINNSSPNPIAGTFANLPDGGIITINGNNFQASYEGSDGNDLTLTVVP